MVRILFNGHDFKFLNHLIEHCEARDDFQVLMDYIPGHEMSHEEQSMELLTQADLIFCEWALGNASWYSINKRPGQKLVIRLHHQEINLEYLKEIHWPNVDQIIFICQENMEIFLRRFPFMASRTSLIFNLIDCADLDRPKLPGYRFNLGFIGTAPMRKAPHLAVEVFKKLRQGDERYKLFIKGKHPWEYDWLWKREEEKRYYEALYKNINDSGFADSVVFDPHGNDMAEWFSKIGFILSTSEHEGSHQAVAEGMAAGSIPIIRNWAGAAKLYPPRFVVKSLDEAVKLVRSFDNDRHDAEQRLFIRQLAKEQFDIPVIISQYDALFSRLMSGNAPVVQDSVPLKDNSPAKPVRAIHLCYLNAGSQSGYEVRVIEETKALVRQGVEVYIVVYLARKWFSEPAVLNAYQKKLEDNTRANVVFFPTDHFFDLNVGEEMEREIDQPLVDLARLHDIRIFHGQALYSTMHALRAARKAGAKVVFDVHGVSPEETEMTGGTPDRVAKTVEFEKQALAEADLKVMVSARMNRFYKEKYQIRELPCQLVPCCVRSDEFLITPEQRELLRTQKGIDGKFVILYLGTLSVWQWPEAMFNLFSHFNRENPDSLLYLMIPGYDHPRAKEFIDKFSLQPGSYILEEVPHSEVGKVIGIADAGLLLRELSPVNLVSSPTKFGEYLASGVPVILTKEIGDYSEMAEQLNVGISLAISGENFEKDELDKLLRFSADVSANRGAWRQRCMDAARENLDWKFYIGQLETQYRKLISQ